MRDGIAPKEAHASQQFGTPVHFIAGAANKYGGIARYCQELYKRLHQHIPVRLCFFRSPPLARRFTFLEHLPLGIEPDEGHGIYHFTRIMGCALMLWRPLRPAVATVHDLGPLVCAEEARSLNAFDVLLFRLQLAGLRRVDWIVVPSNYTKGTICERLGFDSSRVYVTGEGIDREQFRPVLQAKTKLEQVYGITPLPGQYDILYVGTEAPRKNLGALLRAMSLLKQNGMRIRLIKVGGQGHPKYRLAFLQVMEQLNLHLGQDIILVGTVSDDDLATFYSAADVFVLPSLVEGLGLPVLEAMACGTPVVCSRAGALPEIAGDAALLINPHDEQALADAIHAVLQGSNLRTHLVEKGLARCQLFSWDHTASQTEFVYRQVLGLDS